MHKAIAHLGEHPDIRTHLGSGGLKEIQDIHDATVDWLTRAKTVLPAIREELQRSNASSINQRNLKNLIASAPNHNVLRGCIACLTDLEKTIQRLHGPGGEAWVNLHDLRGNFEGLERQVNDRRREALELLMAHR